MGLPEFSDRRAESEQKKEVSPSVPPTSNGKLKRSMSEMRIKIADIFREGRNHGNRGSEQGGTT